MRTHIVGSTRSFARRAVIAAAVVGIAAGCQMLAPDRVAHLGAELFTRYLIAVEVAGTLLFAALVVWNLIRMTMTKYALSKGVEPWRVSFTDAMRCLGTLFQAPARQEIKLLINPDRPGRWEPRKLKQRIKAYDLLNESRQSLKAKHYARCA